MGVGQEKDQKAPPKNWEKEEPVLQRVMAQYPLLTREEPAAMLKYMGY